MAYITKRGSSYSVRYTYQDEHGKSCDKWESFPTKEEAVKRQKQIEHELATGNFLIPSTVTVAEFLMDWLPKQCSKHKWAPKTYQSNLALIQNLIIPYIGEMQMQKLRPYHIEALYDTLSKTPCGQYVGGKRRDLSPKQQKRTLSGTTLHEVHQLLHNSFLLAVEWGILIKSPVPVEAPKKTTQERSIWEVEEMRAALDSMEDPILHLAVHLTLVGALREGEVAGLTPEDIDFDAANGMGTFTVNRSMQRVQKDTLAQVDKGCILRIFPDKLEGSKTSLILKDTKTEASCRTIFMTAALREELKQWLERLKREEALDPERYRNSGMLLRLPNGLAVEPVLIRKKFLKWQDAHPEFPRIVFHGLRHSSATYQLMISGGDIKAVLAKVAKHAEAVLKLLLMVAAVAVKDPEELGVRVLESGEVPEIRGIARGLCETAVGLDRLLAERERHAHAVGELLRDRGLVDRLKARFDEGDVLLVAALARLKADRAVALIGGPFRGRDDLLLRHRVALDVVVLATNAAVAAARRADVRKLDEAAVVHEAAHQLRRPVVGGLAQELALLGIREAEKMNDVGVGQFFMGEDFTRLLDGHWGCS